MRKISFYVVMFLLFITGCQDDLTDQLVVDKNTVSTEDEKYLVETSITKEEAVDVAKTFFNFRTSESTEKSSGITKSEALVQTIMNGQTDEPLMYVINYPTGGWAIVSAEKSFYPILAYSDESSFDLASDNENMDMWLSNTKEAMKSNDILPDSIALEIRSMWTSLTGSDYTGDEKSTDLMKQARTARMTELGQVYGYGSSYIIIPLIGASYYFSSQSEWQSLCDFATAQGSPPEYTIFVGRYVTSTNEVDNLLNMEWHQHSPFNDLVPGGDPAGCASIALSQIMMHYKHPGSFNWNGYNFDWSNIPTYADASSDQPYLIGLVGDIINTHYTSNGSWTLPGSLEDGISFMGFDVTREDHNTNKVKAELLSYQRPVLMGGGPHDLPNPLNYINGHYWVCSGASYSENNLVYFLDLINTSDYSYYYHPYIYKPGNPFTSLQFSRLYFYMNWGWTNGSNNGWYLSYDVNTDNGNYQYGRENFYIKTP